MNKEALQNLSKTCHRSGILPIFLGVLILFAGIINGFDARTIMIGLFVFIVGYSYVKVAKKIDENI